jgi:hypothetical protein
MAPPTTKVLELALEQSVRNIFNSDDRDNLTVNLVRKRVQDQLNLREGFFVRGVWKDRSKTLIKELAVRVLTSSLQTTAPWT